MSGVGDFWEPLQVFDDRRCDELLAACAGLQAVRDRFASVSVTPVPPESFKPLYERVYNLVAAANAKTWRVALDGWLTLQFLSYQPGDAYPWHTDLAEPRARGRVLKLAMSVLLSPPPAFEGGELELMLGSYAAPDGSVQGPAVIAPLRKRGAGVLFPSYLVHRIRPVTSGTRVVLVARLGGASFA